MKNLHLIGIGTGNPDHLTLQALKALQAAQVIFIPIKGDEKSALAEFRRDICARHLDASSPQIIEFAVPERDVHQPSYMQGVDQWHSAIADLYAQLIEQIPDNGTGAFLVWGDPSLYDSTIRIVERVKAHFALDFDYTVVPGITSIQALTASHRIPLNLVGKPVHITTGRRLASGGMTTDNVVVMLDGQQAFQNLQDPDINIFWGAYLGTENELTVSGRLEDVRDRIVLLRENARARHGWIMDTYLLRKGRDFDP